MEELKELRNKLNLTQKEMAEKLGISLSYYTKFEQGVVPITVSLVAKIKEVFGKDIELRSLIKIANINEQEKIARKLVQLQMIESDLYLTDNQIKELAKDLVRYVNSKVGE